MLSKRLQAICDFVTPNSKVVDIGADHGLVDIYLPDLKYYIDKYAIAF